MGGGRHDHDERTYGDLYAELLLADWDIAETARGRGGLTVTFRKHYGTESRSIPAQDVADAIRTFLADLGTTGEGP
jgi:hypothetical protein